MPDSKFLIMRTILGHKHEFFTQKIIQEETELPQTTVSYHVRELYKQNYLQKNPSNKYQYRIKDIAEYSADLLDYRGSRSHYDEPNLSYLRNDLQEKIKWGRNLKPFKVKGQDLIDEKVISFLDDAIKDLKAARLWYRNSTPDLKDVIDNLNLDDWERISEPWGGVLKEKYNTVQWNEVFEDAKLRLKQF